MLTYRRRDDDRPERPVYVPPSTPPGEVADDGPVQGGPFVEPVPEPPAAVPGGHGGGGGSTYTGPVSPDFNIPGVPAFVPPAFNRPNPEDILNAPGYQFRVNQGTNALQNSAAAKGLTRTGGTLKDLLEYGQNFASQEYGNEFNRALQAYDRQYQGAKDQYAPKLAQWQTLSKAEMQRAMAAWQRPWEMYQFQHRGGGGGGGSVIEPPDPTWWAQYQE
jgi:hypothetical protein